MKRIISLFLILFVFSSCVSNNQVQETPTTTTTVFRQNPDDELFDRMKLYVENNNVSLLSSLFENNSPASVKKVINRIVSGGRNLLHKAVLDEYADIVELLLNNGADKTVKDSKGLSAADYAVQARSAKIRDLFGIKEQSEAKDSNTKEDNEIKEESVVMQENHLDEEDYERNSKVSSEFPVRYNVAFGEFDSSLLKAVKDQDFAAAKKALKSGQNVNVTDKRGNSALFYVIAEENDGLLNLLIDNHINCNKQNNVGQLPLLYAVEKENTSFIEALLQGGASINKKDGNGMSAAMLAVLHRNVALLKYLYSQNATFYGTDIHGNTMLHIAIQNEDELTVQFLLDKGCNIKAKNDMGQTCLELMKKSNNIELQFMADEYAK